MASAFVTEKYCIAVLMTCFNRHLTTLKCLDAIKAQVGLSDIRLHIFLVDDRSTDGTREGVSNAHPDVTILQGDGSLYWCGGMRKAWAEALKEDYDFYLWLNDDTHIHEKTIRELVNTSKMLLKQEDAPVILTGATREPFTDVCTYGGVNLNGFLTRPAFRKVDPIDRPLQCDTINGNCVLVPREVAKRVGNLSAAFTHGIGDFDYGLRAQKFGIQCWLAEGFIGECSGKSKVGSWQDQDLSMDERIVAMHQPTGLPPIREWMVFTWRHAGWLWPVCWVRSIAGFLFPRLRIRRHLKQ